MDKMKPPMDLNDLSPDQRHQLQRLNDRLAVIEQHIQREATTLNTHLQARVQDPTDWFSDYEIELEVTVCLREDDPAFQEDDDNILATLRERLKGSAQHDFGIDDGINHNAFQQMDGHPMQGEVHCWLYHCLYDHTDLWFDEMLRIGRIWVDIQVWYQHICEV
jgi:hypothetical protein